MTDVTPSSTRPKAEAPGDRLTRLEDQCTRLEAKLEQVIERIMFSPATIDRMRQAEGEQ